MAAEVVLFVDESGTVRAIYDDAVDFRALAEDLGGGVEAACEVRRASHVEPTERGEWTADMAPVGGPLLGPFPKRAEALDAERAWLVENGLGVQP